jgi:hypothetical protein
MFRATIFLFVAIVVSVAFAPSFAKAQAQQSCAEPVSRSDDIREWLRAEHLKLRGTELAVTKNFGSEALSTVSFGIENCSGIALGLGLNPFNFAAGPCATVSFDAQSVSVISGLRPVVFTSDKDVSDLYSDPNPSARFSLVPTGARVKSYRRILVTDGVRRQRIELAI